MKTLKPSHRKILAMAALIGVCVLGSSAVAATNDGGDNSNIGSRWIAAITAAVTVVVTSGRW